MGAKGAFPKPKKESFCRAEFECTFVFNIWPAFTHCTGFPNQGWMQLNGFLTNDTGKHAKTQLGLSLTVPWRWRSGSTQDRDRGMLPKILHVLGVGGYDKSRLKNIQSRPIKGLG